MLGLAGALDRAWGASPALPAPPPRLQESAEGYHETLGYGLAAMQGWRVQVGGGRGAGALITALGRRAGRVASSAAGQPKAEPCALAVPQMEDAHIAALDLDPATRTSLFSIFDGHGGKAVAKYSAKHLVGGALLRWCWRAVMRWCWRPKSGSLPAGPGCRDEEARRPWAHALRCCCCCALAPSGGATGQNRGLQARRPAAGHH